MSAFAHGAGAFVALLAVAVLIAMLAERVRVPAAVALVAMGSVVPINPPFAFGDALLFVFLPPLIFEASWNLDLASLRRTAWRIALLAIPGTVFSAGVVAAAVIAVHALPPAPALLLAAIVSATDPVAVVAAFRGVPVPVDLRTIVEGESLANDGVALIMFAFALATASGAATSLPLDVVLGLAEIVGGAAIGCAAALACVAVLRATRAAEYEVTVTVVLAYGAYLCANAAHCSGIFATAAGAITLRALAGRLRDAIAHAEDVDRVWNALAFIANAVVFLATGFLIRPDRIAHEPLLVIVAVAAVWAGRAVLAVVAGGTRAGRITAFLAGMRGALPLALALSLPDAVPFRPQIIDATYAVVLATIVVQGAPLTVIVRRLFAQGAARAAS